MVAEGNPVGAVFQKEFFEETETDPPGRVLKGEPGCPGVGPDIKLTVLKRKTEPARFILNQLGLSLRFIRPETMIDVGNDQGEPEILAEGAQKAE
jgi:hypothetical protein